ncbi:MAG: 1-acyl-sn-glycerol-3-phosphate acyltransferase [Pseudomonadota bacterium]
MIFVRSLTFNVLFYLVTFIEMIILTPFYFIGERKSKWWVPRLWSRVNMWMLRHIVGVKFVIEGTENIPDSGYILAPKHQSSMDTFCFIPWFNDPVMILKRVLMKIPLFGWYLARMEMIPIDRGNREDAIRKVNAGAREAIASGRELLIYPEGTRRAPGAEPAYKTGIAHLYAAMDAPVVIIAHNAGLFWPKNKFMRYPGTFKARFLPPIEPGLEKRAFMKELVSRTENAVDELLFEAAEAPDCPPLQDVTRKRVEELREAKGSEN